MVNITTATISMAMKPKMVLNMEMVWSMKGMTSCTLRTASGAEGKALASTVLARCIAQGRSAGLFNCTLMDVACVAPRPNNRERAASYPTMT